MSTKTPPEHSSVRPPAATPSGSAPIGVVDIVGIVVRYVWLLVLIPPACVIIGTSLFLLGGRTYDSDSAFSLVSGISANSRVSSLAAQFGVPMGGRPADPPDLYITILRSRDVLREVVLSEFTAAPTEESATPATQTLVEIYGLDSDIDEENIVSAIRILRENIRVSTNIMSGVVTLRTTAPTPHLAEQVNRRILDVANKFTIERRSDQSRIERAFIEARLTDVRDKLTAAENELEAFLSTNRHYTNSPSLLAEHARLQRNVQHHLQVFISLAQAYEQAKIDEVRNTAVISIIDPPEGSALPSMRLIFILAITGLVGLGVAVSSAFVAEYIRRERLANPDAFHELKMLYRTAFLRTK